MGVPMAGNLLKAAMNFSCGRAARKAARPLTGKGAKLCASPKEVGASADVISPLSHRYDVEQVVLGEGGVIHGAGPDRC